MVVPVVVPVVVPEMIVLQRRFPMITALVISHCHVLMSSRAI